MSSWSIIGKHYCIYILKHYWKKVLNAQQLAVTFAVWKGNEQPMKKLSESGSGGWSLGTQTLKTSPGWEAPEWDYHVLLKLTELWQKTIKSDGLYFAEWSYILSYLYFIKCFVAMLQQQRRFVISLNFTAETRTNLWLTLIVLFLHRILTYLFCLNFSGLKKWNGQFSSPWGILSL